jgi:hypothetical protein
VPGQAPEQYSRDDFARLRKHLEQRVNMSGQQTTLKAARFADSTHLCPAESPLSNGRPYHSRKSHCQSTIEKLPAKKRHDDQFSLEFANTYGLPVYVTQNKHVGCPLRGVSCIGFMPTIPDDKLLKLEYGIMDPTPDQLSGRAYLLGETQLRLDGQRSLLGQNLSENTTLRWWIRHKQTKRTKNLSKRYREQMTGRMPEDSQSVSSGIKSRRRGICLSESESVCGTMASTVYDL